MRIAVFGNGKMGKQIIRLAEERGHTISSISCSNKPAHKLTLKNTDIAIDFSTPNTAFYNISHALNKGIPIVSGTTGWLNQLPEAKELCKKKQGCFLYSSNFSLGMNIFFKLNQELAKLTKSKNYKSKIHEIHHTEKLDIPSGTAKTLAQEMNMIVKSLPPITSERKEGIIGEHSVTYYSSIDHIELKHTAKNREGFAIGAIIAGEWILGKTGYFTMQDVLKKV